MDVTNSPLNDAVDPKPHSPFLGIRLHWGIAIAILLAITSAVFANGLQGDLIFDDELLVQNKSCIKGISHIPDMFTGGACGYRPVRYASLALEYSLHGGTPLGYHATNLLLHLLAVLLIFALAQRFSGNRMVALVAALLYAVHPTHPDSVTYISGRRDVLCGLFYLAGFAAYVQFVGSGRKRWLLAVACCYALSILSKEMAVTLPAMLVMYDLYWTLSSKDAHHTVWQKLLELLRRRWWLYAPLFVMAVAFVIYRGVLHSASQMGASEFWGGNVLNNCLTVGALYLRYYEMILAPIRLLGDYFLFAVPLVTSLSDPRWILGALATAVILALAIWLRKRHPLATFGIAWFYVSMLPVSHIFPHHELMAEHYLYIPLMGLALAVSDLLRPILDHQRHWRIGVVCISCWLIFCSARLVLRNEDYQGNDSFFSRTLYWAPNAIRARIWKGDLWLRQGRLDEARQEFEQLPKLKQLPPSAGWRLFSRLIYVTMKQGQFDIARRYLQQMIQLKLASPQFLRGLGIALGKKQRSKEALEVLRIAKKLDPNDILIDINLSVTLMRLGQQQEACRILSRAFTREPDNTRVKSMLSACSNVPRWW